jgi:hypothetical protein
MKQIEDVAAAQSSVRALLTIPPDRLRELSTETSSPFPVGSDAGSSEHTKELFRRLRRAHTMTEEAVIWLAEAVALLRKNFAREDGTARRFCGEDDPEANEVIAFLAKVDG